MCLSDEVEVQVERKEALSLMSVEKQRSRLCCERAGGHNGVEYRWGIRDNLEEIESLHQDACRF
jgi:hypothetical protein